MRTAFRFHGIAILLVALMASPAWADSYSDTIDVFKKAIPSGFFEESYGYAVFPTIGKGGAVVGGAHGKGRVYAKGVHVGDTSMTQLTVGFQLGGQAFSQIIFFEDERAFTQFSSGNFEFGAQATAVAITAGASARPVILPVPLLSETMPKQSLSTTAGWPYSPLPRAV